MKNIILEEINRVRLLMVYNNQKTLTENVEKTQLIESAILNEQTGKAFLKSIFGTADDAALAALKSTRSAKYLAGVRLFDDVAVYGKTGLNSGDDVMNALIKGTLNKAQLSELAKGLMKSGKATGNLRTALTDKAADLMMKDARYSKLTQKQIKSLLSGRKGKGYDPAIADEIATKFVNKRAKISAGSGNAGKPRKTSSGGRNTGKPRKTPPPKPKPISGKETIWTKLRNKIKGLPLKNAVKILVAAGGIYLLWRFLTDDENGLFPTCLTKAMSEDDLNRLSNEGLEFIKISNTGNEVIDQNGGGEFYTDKTFKTGNKQFSGKWDYNGSAIIVTVGGTEYSIVCGTGDSEERDNDDDNNNGGGYKNCPNFPFTKFCKNDKIRKIQECIGAKVDGTYGPETERKLKENGYDTTITEEIYNRIIDNCGNSEQNTTSDDETTQQGTEFVDDGTY